MMNPWSKYTLSVLDPKNVKKVTLEGTINSKKIDVMIVIT